MILNFEYFYLAYIFIGKNQAEANLLQYSHPQDEGVGLPLTKQLLSQKARHPSS